MYNKKIKNPAPSCTGVMFHEFHDGKKYKKTYGSISRNEFIKIIKSLKNYNIVSPNEFTNKLYYKNKKNICLTFDDGLKSKYKIALPVLKKFKIKAFFFIYTEIFQKKINLFEITRYFINSKFKNFDEFYIFL